MKIIVNGKEENISTCSILDYIRKKGLKPEAAVVEYNRKIVKKEEWEKIQLKEDDNLEILSFVGGG